MPLHISVTSLSDFMVCRRMYYYKRIKKYEKVIFDIPFLVGRVVHHGMNYVLQNKKNAVDLTLKYFKEEQKEMKQTFILDEKQQKELDEQQYVTTTMIAAYMRKYGVMLRGTEHLQNEVEGAVQLEDDVTFVIKLDNLLRIRQKKVLHELKTSKYITPDYVKMIQTDLQTAIYYYFYNFIFEKSPIEEIMYDVIRKPSIRQKKSETYKAFLTRLGEWYQKPDDGAVFYIERNKAPKITEESVINTVQKVSEEMLRSKTKEDYYQDFTHCHSYYGKQCPYYQLCHEGGESKENLLLYTIRKPYLVDKTNIGKKK